MAYLALYRKFRPATLDEVAGQDHIVTVLKNQVETGKIGHAYLFCGPRGTGKTSVAKIFAAAINCESPVNGSPCGKCASCRALADPSNLDISEIDAASNNGVDEMRDLREKVQYPPVAGKYKVYIVDEVHMLSAGAFNALLKTLEEPPAHAVFILATTESQKIPATVLSRCMRFDFKLFPQEELEKLLEKILTKTGKEYEKEAVAAIARAGAGSARDMLSVADTCISYSAGKLTYSDVTAVLGTADFSAMGELCLSMLSGRGGDAFEQTERILAEGKSVGMLLKDVMNFLGACATAKMCRDAEKILALPKDMYALVSSAAQKTDGHTLLRATEIFARAETDLRYSLSPRVVFETAVFKASMPQADYDTESLLARIEMLERRLAEGNFTAATGGSGGADPIGASDGGSSFSTENAVLTGERFAQKEQPAASKSNAYAAEEDAFPPFPSDETPPPPDDEIGENVSFGGGFSSGDRRKSRETAPIPVPVQTPVAARETAPVKAPFPDVSAAQSAPIRPIVRIDGVGDAKATFGGFLRALRKTARNGVLFTLCMDLDGKFEDGKFVLYTESETIYASLTKAEHYALISQAFSAIGVSDFEVRLRGRKADEFNKSLSELKEKFSGIKIDVK